MQEYAEAAIEKNFDEIAFTDHFTLLKNKNFSKNSLDLVRLESYINTAKEVIRKYSGKLEIKLGLEVDYIPENEHTIEEILSSYDFDFLIGSVHFIDEICVDCAHSKNKIEELVRNNGFNKVYEKYMNLVKKAAESGLFNIVGHMDLVRIWGYNPSNCELDEVKALNSIKKQNMVVEVSSRGLRHPINSIYPSERIMNNCKKMEIPVTISTDAHSVNEIDYAFELLVNYVKKFGYRKIATFKNREIFMKDL